MAGTAVAFAKESADLTIVYLDEYQDTNETNQYVEALGVTWDDIDFEKRH